jgi:aminoglycoside N3'-acetyltransferase
MKKDFSKLMKDYEEKFISAYSNREEKRKTKHQTHHNLGARIVKLDN